jgi:phosphate starvation-inducible protein PhoH
LAALLCGPVDEDAADVYQKASEQQRDIIRRIEAKEAARIRADTLRLDLPARQWSIVRD